MDPPSIETISKYILKPLRAPPPPPRAKVPATPTRKASIVSTKQDETLEDEDSFLSLVSLLRQDKHGGSLRYLPKPRFSIRKSDEYMTTTRNPDGSITTTTMIPPHSSVEVGPGTHQILADLDSFKSRLQSSTGNTDYACHDRFRLKDVTYTRPTNYNYELMPFVNPQLSKRHPSARKINNKTPRSPSSESMRRSKNPLSYVVFAPSSQSIFFDPKSFNNINTRPGYFEAFSGDEYSNWTLPLKVYEEANTFPHLQPVEAVDKPYTGSIACDGPELESFRPKHVRLRANLRYDNAYHKRWNVDRNEPRGEKASIWPLWKESKDNKKKRLVQMQQLTLATIRNETIATDERTVHSVDDFFDNEPYHSSSRKTRQEMEEDDDSDKTVVPDQEDRDGEPARRHYTPQPPRSDAHHENENREIGRVHHADEDEQDLSNLAHDLESILHHLESLVPAIERLEVSDKGAN